jgi:hypothetical protein
VCFANICINKSVELARKWSQSEPKRQSIWSTTRLYNVWQAINTGVPAATDSVLQTHSFSSTPLTTVTPILTAIPAFGLLHTKIASSCPGWSLYVGVPSI